MVSTFLQPAVVLFGSVAVVDRTVASFANHECGKLASSVQYLDFGSFDNSENFPRTACTAFVHWLQSSWQWHRAVQDGRRGPGQATRVSQNRIQGAKRVRSQADLFR